MFRTKLNEKELKAWLAFEDVIDNFLDNHRLDDYVSKVVNLLQAYYRDTNSSNVVCPTEFASRFFAFEL